MRSAAARPSRKQRQCIVLIAPTSIDLGAFGVRTLASILRLGGHDVRLILLPGGIDRLRFRTGYTYRYGSSLVRSVVARCADADFVGLSFTSPYRDRALQITAALREALDVPILWGGLHPTAAPEDLMGRADAACIGEADRSFPELMAAFAVGEDWRVVPNFAFPVQGQLERNSLHPRVEDLNSLPVPDWVPDGTFVGMPGARRVQPMRPELLRTLLPRRLHTEGTFSEDNSHSYITLKSLTSRGCPHACSYCGNSIQHELYGGSWGVRWRDPEHVMEELKRALAIHPFVEAISFCDDAFTARSHEDLEQFLDVYAREIGLPFDCQVTPDSLDRRKVEALLDAGLYYLDIGIQTGSASGREALNRASSREDALRAAHLLHDYVDRMALPAYHVILDNPWESREDVLATLDLLLELPPPFRLKRSSLVPYPGTPIHRRAVDEGVLVDAARQIFNKHLEQPGGSYPNLLVYLAGFSRLPRGVIRALAQPTFAAAMDRAVLEGPYSWTERGLERLISANKGVRALGQADLRRFVVFGRRMMGWPE